MPLPVLTLAQMREWEARAWAAGQSQAEVIRRVSLAVAECALRLTRQSDAIVILAGKGHNGDDARAALPHLHGRRSTLLLVNDPATQLGELRAALGYRPALVIDGLFGIGLNRPLDAAWQEFINVLNQASVPVLAVDLPSGLNGDTGENFGTVVNANVTLTVGAPKAGLIQPRAWPGVGRIEVTGDVGLGACPVADTELQWVTRDDSRGFPPPRPITSHKGDYGHLAIVAGSVGYHGAAVLATRSAQRAGAGLVTLHTLADAYFPAAAQLQGAMVRPWSADTKLSSPFTAVLIGPGLAAPQDGDQLPLITRRLWRDVDAPVVVDASALDWLPQDSPVPRHAIRVLTPHPGEAARLLKTTAAQIQANRPFAVREISRRFGNCWVVLKGHQTLIGRSTGELTLNSSGNPRLAQGGSGDVLAGFLAGLLAQPVLQADAARTLRYAVWQHGAAADALTARQPSWIVEELPAALGLA
jgi:hydroxyethylthiazole kinase-like uncharacterized protein yjeF